MCGVESLWLLKADQDKLDAFYASCLRQIAKIAPSFMSCASNKTVLNELNATPLSLQLVARQLVLLGKICRRGSDDLTRAVTLSEGAGVSPRQWTTRRRVGRPCLRWTNCMYATALGICNSSQSMLQRMIYNPCQSAWYNHVYSQLKAGAFPVNAPS